MFLKQMTNLLKRINKKQIILCLLFLAIGICCYLLILNISKEKLIEADQRLVTIALDEYLLQNISKTLRYDGSIIINNVEEIGQLSFIKLIKGAENIIITKEKQNKLLTQTIINLGSTTNDWIKIDKQIVTVIHRQLNSKFSIQAGAIATHHQTYQSLVKYCSIALIIYIIACPILCRLLFNFCKMPLEQTIAGIDEIRKTRFSKMSLPTKGLSAEQTLLHQQINNLLADNQHLLAEIQGSLDNLAHDLRTPVARMRSIAEYGLKENNKEELTEALVSCLEESEYVAKMLAVMMSVAEAESGTMRLNINSQNLSESIIAAIELYEYVAEDKEITVTFDAKSEIKLNLDDIRIRQVWANLLDNGIKYGKIGGHIEITTWQEGNFAYIAFQDDGMGISATEIPRIWERLYRGDRSRTKKGLGLGLNYVQAVITAHGGTIKVTSNLNQGSCFTVRLPTVPLKLN